MGEERTLSRRGFLQGAGVAAALLGTSSALCSINVNKAFAFEGNSTDVVGEYKKYQSTPIEPLAPSESWDEEFDVLIAGSGGGLAGAVAAQELGLSVLLVEKSVNVGGASKEASVWVISGSDAQTALGLPDISSKLVGAAAAEITVGERYTKYFSNVNGAATRIANWMGSNGFSWQPTTVLGGVGPVGISPAGSEEGGMTARAVKYCYEFLNGKLASGGLRTKTALTGLVIDAGEVVGARIADWDGNESYIKTAKGVLLATGGMAANREMLQEYIPHCYSTCKFSSAGTEDSGEGILMGLGAGAQFDGYDNYDAFDGGIDGVDWNTYMYISAVQIARQPWLAIDVHGERCPYYKGGSSSYKQAGKVFSSLPRNEAYVIFDSTYETVVDTFKQGMCRLPIDADTMPDEGRVPSAIVNPHWKDGVKEAIGKGLIKQCDTLVELAESLNLSPDVVKAAVDEWNETCAAGTDSTGKMMDDYLYPILEPPYYGMAIGAFTFATHAGLAVDENSQVINVSGETIPGLYACGCAVGKPTEGANGSCAFSAGSACLAMEHIAGSELKGRSE